MSFEGILKDLRSSTSLEQLGCDEVGEVYQHDDVEYVWYVPFKHCGRCYAMFFVYEPDETEYYQSIVKQESGVTIGHMIFGIKFVRADIDFDDSKEEMLTVSASQQGGTLSSQEIFSFPDKLLQVAEKHYELFDVHCYVLVAADDKLVPLYNRMARKRRLKDNGIVRLLPTEEGSACPDNGWFAFVPKHTIE